MVRIKKNDEVIIIAGKDKGAIGTVTKVLENKLLIDGVNLAKKHVKPNPQAGIEGGIITKEMPIAVSNVAIYNSETKKADRIGFRINEDKKKERFFKSNGNTVA